MSFIAPFSFPIGVLTMGMTAENIAEKYVISRTAQDYFACESQEKAQAAIKSGRFDDEIEPLPVKKKKEILFFFTVFHYFISRRFHIKIHDKQHNYDDSRHYQIPVRIQRITNRCQWQSELLHKIAWCC